MVNHLGEQLSALVDGELNGAELDRVHAHLVTCEECRAEVATLRDLKRQLRGLAGLADRPATEELTRKLLAMAGPGGPVPSRRLGRGRTAPRPAFRPYRGTAPHDHAEREPGPQPSSPVHRVGRGRRRRRYLLAGAVSVAVTVGVGAAAFTMGGGGPQPGPRITPQLEMFNVEHANNNGQVPLVEPTASGENSAAATSASP